MGGHCLVGEKIREKGKVSKRSRDVGSLMMEELNFDKFAMSRNQMTRRRITINHQYRDFPLKFSHLAYLEFDMC